MVSLARNCNINARSACFLTRSADLFTRNRNTLEKATKQMAQFLNIHLHTYTLFIIFVPLFCKRKCDGKLSD